MTAQSAGYHLPDMPLEITFDDKTPYLSVKAVGRATLGDMITMIEAVADEAKRRGLNRVLVDQTAIEEDFKFTDHFAIGAHVANVCREFERAASVVRADRRTGTSEVVAQKQGVQLRVFTSFDVADSWLRSPG
ncbi:MAG: STAS/SEC14 domain-containing protein [Ramlibacter sp.]